MKKKILALLVIAGLSTNLSAGEIYKGSAYMGYSANNIEHSDTEGGVYMGFDTFKNLGNGYLLGFGADATIFNYKNSGASILSLDAKVAYSFDTLYDVPVVLKAGVGYGITYFEHNAKDDWGMQYSGSVEYNFYKNLGIGYKYKTREVDIGSSKFNINSSIFYINRTF